MGATNGSADWTRRLVTVVVALLMVGSLAPAQAQGRLTEVRTAAWEGEDPYPWLSVDPAAAGFDLERLAAAEKLAEEGGSDSLLVLHGGKIVLERYWNGKTSDDVQQMYSATKSAFSLLVGRLLADEGIDSLDRSLGDLLPQIRAQGLAQLTFRNVMAMESGLEQSAELDRQDRAAQLPQLELALRRRIVQQPFTWYHYNNAAYRALFYVLEETTRLSIPLLTTDELFEPLGMVGAYWMVWRKNDESFGYQSIRMRPRDLAKIGLVMLDDGMWLGTPFVAAEYVHELVTAPAPDVNPSYGLFWHLNSGSFFRSYTTSDRIDEHLLPGTPGDAFGNYGSGGQILVCVPSLDLVWVRTGASIPSTLWDRPSWVAELSRAIVAAAAPDGLAAPEAEPETKAE